MYVNQSEFKIGRNIVGVMAYFGIFGNIICIIVSGSILDYVSRKRKGNRNSTNSQKFYWYFLFMTIADLIYSCVVAVDTSIDVDIRSYSKIICFSIDPLFECIDYYGVLLNLIVTIDRLHMIVRPIKHNSFITQRRPRLIGLAAFFLSFLYQTFQLAINTPSYFEDAYINNNNIHNTSVCYFSSSSDYSVLMVERFETSLIIGILLLAFLLNILTWCLQCYRQSNYHHQSSLSITIDDAPTNHSHNKNRLISSSSLFQATQVASGNGGSGRERIRSNRPGKKTNHSFYLVMIALNITDLPFYIIYILFESKIINENATIFIVLSSIFKITSHSINIIIYLLRKEFRFICIEIFRNIINRIRKVIRIKKRHNESECQIEPVNGNASHVSSMPPISNAQAKKIPRPKVIYSTMLLND